jgi:hypothetical protein
VELDSEVSRGGKLGKGRDFGSGRIETIGIWGCAHRLGVEDRGRRTCNWRPTGRIGHEEDGLMDEEEGWNRES